MTVNNITDIAARPPTKNDQPQVTGEQGFSAELERAEEQQSTVKKPDKQENITEVNEPKDEQQVQPEEDVKPTESVSATGVPIPIIPVIEQMPVSSTETEIAENTVPTDMDILPEQVIEKSDVTAKKNNLVLPKETQITPDNKQNATVSIAEEEPDFAKQVMKEANAILEKQTIADAKSSSITDEKVQTVIAEHEASNPKDSTQKDSKGSTQSHTAFTANVAENGRVDIKTAGAQMPEPTVQTDEKPSLLTKLVDQVRSTVSTEKTEFFLQLKPEHLGGLSIMLSAEEKGMVARLATSSRDVQNVLQSDMAQLQAALREKGINVVHMEVIYDQGAGSTAKDHSGGRQQQFGQTGNGQGRIPENLEGATAYYDTISYYEALAEQGGSVEFSA